MADGSDAVDVLDEDFQTTLTVVAGQFLIAAAMSESPDSDMATVTEMITETTGGTVETLILSAIRSIQALMTSAELNPVDVGTIGGALIDSANESESEG
jgi:hypothetical protein